MEDSQKQNLVLAFTNVLRTSSLTGIVDIQRATMAFSSYLAEVHEAPIALEPLYTYLLDQKAPEPGVREVIVFLKSREARFGIPLELPPALASLTAEEQQKIVTAFAQRGTTSGTYAGRPPPGAVPSPPPAPSSQAGKDEQFSKKKTEPRGQRRLVIALGVCVVGFIASTVFNEVSREPPPAEIQLDPAGLPCDKPLMAKGVVMCKVPASFLKNPKEVIQAKGALTKASAVARGGTQVLVLGIEDSKIHYKF